MFDRIFGNGNNSNQVQSAPVSMPAASAPDPVVAQSVPTDIVPPVETPVQQPEVTVPVQPPAPVVPVPEIKPEEPVVEAVQEQKTTEMPIDEEYKNKIGLQLTEAMLKGIDEGNMTESEMSVISGYILDNIDNIHTHVELNSFLQYLAQRWSVFKQVRKVEAGIEKASGDSAKAEEIANLIHENKIDDALTVAHNATAAVN